MCWGAKWKPASRAEQIQTNHTIMFLICWIASMECELSQGSCPVHGNYTKVIKPLLQLWAKSAIMLELNASLSAAAALFLIKEQIGEVSNTKVSHRETSLRAVSIKLKVHKRAREVLLLRCMFHKENRRKWVRDAAKQATHSVSRPLHWPCSFSQFLRRAKYYLVIHKDTCILCRKAKTEMNQYLFWYLFQLIK